MDAFLQSSSNVGIKELYDSIGRDPTFLEVDNDAMFVDTPLHKAVNHGHSEVAMEILRLMPLYGRKMNREGYSPLHIALDKNNVDLVRGMIKMDPELIRVPGKEGITPLHHVAGTNQVNLLAEFLLRCPDSILDLNVWGETAVHVAVNKNNLEAFKVLYGWVSRVGRSEVLEQRDWKGNSVLRLATEANQTEVMDQLNPSTEGMVSKWSRFVGNVLLYLLTGPLLISCRRMKGICSSSPSKTQTLAEYLSSPPAYPKFIAVLTKFKLKRETRNAILVVAVLISTATFQVVLSPPGVSNGHNSNTDNSPTITGNRDGKPMVSTTDVFFGLLALGNTLAFSLSLVVMVIVLPLHWSNFFLYLSLAFLSLTYHLALFAILPNPGFIATLSLFFPYYAFVSCVHAYNMRSASFNSAHWRRVVQENEVIVEVQSSDPTPARQQP